MLLLEVAVVDLGELGSHLSVETRHDHFILEGQPLEQYLDLGVVEAAGEVLL